MNNTNTQLNGAGAAAAIMDGAKLAIETGFNIYDRWNEAEQQRVQNQMILDQNLAQNAIEISAQREAFRQQKQQYDDYIKAQNAAIADQKDIDDKTYCNNLINEVEDFFVKVQRPFLSWISSLSDNIYNVILKNDIFKYSNVTSIPSLVNVEIFQKYAEKIKAVKGQDSEKLKAGDELSVKIKKAIEDIETLSNELEKAKKKQIVIVSSNLSRRDRPGWFTGDDAVYTGLTQYTNSIEELETTNWTLTGVQAQYPEVLAQINAAFGGNFKVAEQNANNTRVGDNQADIEMNKPRIWGHKTMGADEDWKRYLKFAHDIEDYKQNKKKLADLKAGVKVDSEALKKEINSVGLGKLYDFSRLRQGVHDGDIKGNNIIPLYLKRFYVGEYFMSYVLKEFSEDRNLITLLIGTFLVATKEDLPLYPDDEFGESVINTNLFQKVFYDDDNSIASIISRQLDYSKDTPEPFVPKNQVESVFRLFITNKDKATTYFNNLKQAVEQSKEKAIIKNVSIALKRSFSLSKEYLSGLLLDFLITEVSFSNKDKAISILSEVSETANTQFLNSFNENLKTGNYKLLKHTDLGLKFEDDFNSIIPIVDLFVSDKTLKGDDTLQDRFSQYVHKFKLYLDFQQSFFLNNDSEINRAAKILFAQQITTKNLSLEAKNMAILLPQLRLMNVHTYKITNMGYFLLLNYLDGAELTAKGAEIDGIFDKHVTGELVADPLTSEQELKLHNIISFLKKGVIKSEQIGNPSILFGKNNDTVIEILPKSSYDKIPLTDKEYFRLGTLLKQAIAEQDKTLKANEIAVIPKQKILGKAPFVIPKASPTEAGIGVVVIFLIVGTLLAKKKQTTVKGSAI